MRESNTAACDCAARILCHTSGTADDGLADGFFLAQ